MYHPKSDCGDYVVVVNSQYATVEDPKMVYRWNTGWPGGKRELDYKEMTDRHPTLVIYLMLSIMWLMMFSANFQGGLPKTFQRSQSSEINGTSQGFCRGRSSVSG